MGRDAVVFTVSPVSYTHLDVYKRQTTGRVNGIISNIVIVKADGPVAQNEICYVWTGDTKMMAEVIKVIGDAASVQVFDSTRGLKIGDRVEFEGHMLDVTLAPVSYTHLMRISSVSGGKGRPLWRASQRR